MTRFVLAVLVAWYAVATTPSLATGAPADVTTAAVDRVSTAAAGTVGYACCDSADRYGDCDVSDDDGNEDGGGADCRECRRYCSGFVVDGTDGDAAADQPLSRRCTCDLQHGPPCRSRVGCAVKPDETGRDEDAGDRGEGAGDRDEGAGDRDEGAEGRDEGAEGRDEDARGRDEGTSTSTARWTDSAWYANARTFASGCSITAIVFAVIVYAGVLEPRDYSNFAKHYAFWLLVMATLTLMDDLEATWDLDNEFGYLKLFTICISNNLQIMMSYEVYCFLKSVREINSYYTQMFKDNLYYHTLCYGGAIAVTGTCFFIELNGQHSSNAFFDFKNVKILNIFYLFSGLISICFNLVALYCASNLKTRFVSSYHRNITRMYNEKLLIRKQLFGLVSLCWLIDLICVIAQLCGMNYSVLQDLKALQGVGTFVILVFKRSIMDQIKKWILAHACGVRPANEL